MVTNSLSFVANILQSTDCVLSDLVGAPGDAAHLVRAGLDLLALGPADLPPGGRQLDQDWVGAGRAEPQRPEHLQPRHQQLRRQRLGPGAGPPAAQGLQ